MSGRDIVGAALAARTFADAQEVQSMIEVAIGARHQRPLADMPNNQGLGSSTGSFDHLILENVTNMQDALLERDALAKHGNASSVPYESPHKAAAGLFKGISTEQLARKATVEFHESDPPTNKTKRITAIFRDLGCGMTPGEVPRTIFGVGRWHKDEWDWLQGAFGMGAKATFRNARAVVLVTRKAPELLPDQAADRIAVAVLLREQRHKVTSIYYLTTDLWNEAGDEADPFSVPAAEYPQFDPGTHLALVSYGVEGFHRARGGGDERSFEAVLNTRLFVPVTPVRFTNTMLTDRVRNYNLTGLGKRLRDNPRDDRVEGAEQLPFNIDGKTYHLTVSYFVFAPPGDPGERRNFVAHDHAVVFTSNGQVHHHWTSAEFRNNTDLRKLHKQAFVVVETDELPIEVRTSLFTAERSGMERNDTALLLEEAVAGFIGDWEPLKRINAELVREAIKSSGDARPTIRIAQRISRALKVRGFSISGPGKSGGGASGGSRGGGTRPPIDLYRDPTTLEGPAHVVAEEGRTKWVTYTLNAVDDFIPRRGELTVTCSHPEINGREITVGQLRSGRVRVSIAVPARIDLGTYELEVLLKDWTRSSGGIGPTLHWSTEFEILQELERRPRGPGKTSGKSGSGQGGNVALIWSTPDKQDEWDKMSVGDVQMVEAAVLAEEQPDYRELSQLGDMRIPTLILNSEYAQLKQYLGSRASVVEERTLEDCKERYAVGVGVGLLMLDKEEQRRIKSGERTPDGWLARAKEAVARGILVMMPEFDALAREAGLDDG